MSTVILACSSLKDYVEAAQMVNHTDYPVVYLDRKYHMEPKLMRQVILEEEGQMSPDIDTVLVAMGFCGGSWDQVTFSRRTIIPRVDDCISLLLQVGHGDGSLSHFGGPWGRFCGPFWTGGTVLWATRGSVGHAWSMQNELLTPSPGFI